MPTANHPDRSWRPPWQCAFGAGILQSAGTAWFHYLGYVDAPGVTVKFIEMQLKVLGVGTQNAELGLFDSPLAPNGASQTLVKLTSSQTLTDMTTGSPPFVVRNTSSLAYAVPAGTQLWAGVRTLMGTTQVTISEGVSHTPLGEVLVTSGCSSFTSITATLGALPTMAIVNHFPPYLWASED